MANEPKFLDRNEASNARFQQEGLALIDSAVDREISAQTIPGAVYVVTAHGSTVVARAAGILNPATGEPMRPDAIFRIYSLTKPVVSVAVLRAIEEGRLKLSDNVVRFFPEFAAAVCSGDHEAAATAPISIHDLLRHTSGLTYDFMGNTAIHKSYAEQRLSSSRYQNHEFCGRLARLPLVAEPGTEWNYGHSTDVLGAVLEIIYQKSLEEVLAEKVFLPLGMSETSFTVPESKFCRLAEPPNEDRQTGTRVHLLGGRKPTVQQSGGGGLLSTAMDYQRFMQMVLNGGSLEGERVIGEESIRLATTDALGSIPRRGPFLEAGLGFTLGGYAVRLLEDNVAGEPVGVLHWAGLSGASFFIDPKRQLSGLMLIQQPAAREHMQKLFRAEVYKSLAAN